MDKYTPDQHVIINVSGRGDKDIFTIAEAYQDPAWAEFIQQRASAYAANNFAAKGHGPTIALPIWINYMDYKLESLGTASEEMPEKISFVRVNKITGELDEDPNGDFYFELFLDENIN